MATAGLEPRAGDPKYYAVANRQEFVKSLGLITGIVTHLALSSPPPAPDDVAVKVDGAKINRDPARMDGWQYSDDKKSVQIFGATCDRLKAGTAKDVNITYGCPGIVIE